MKPEHPSRRRPRRQPHPVRPLQHASTPTRPTRTCSPPRIDGLVARFGLEGERLGEVVAGAVLKHSRDFNLTRECVLGSRLAPETPGHRHPAGLRHRPPGGDPGRQQDRARPDRGRHRRRHRHHLRRARSRSARSSARSCSRSTRAKTPAGPARRAGQDPARRHRPVDPAERRAAHRAVDGRARRADRAGVADRPRGAGRARGRVAPAPRRGVRRAASSTTWSRRSAASSATRTCAPTPRSRSSPSSSRSSARARRPR